MKGSEWRKWDLHVHTPASLIENQYGGDTPEAWEKFIKALEELPEEIKVIGINDYLFIDGYKKVLEYKKADRLKNIELILPVVEFRLREFVGHEKLKRINYHLIFANEEILSVENLETHFTNGLRGKARLDPEHSEVSWGGAISKTSLSDLGQKILDSMPEGEKPKYPNLIEIGFNNINFDQSAIEQILGEGSDENTYLKDNYLKAIGKAEWEDFRWSGSIADKKTVINGAHFVFAASPSATDAQQSKDKLTEQNVNDRLLHCSDAHGFRPSQNPDVTKPKELGHCFTWIKAEPTFEGLKQVLFEPTRLALSEASPIEPTNVIDSFSLDIPKKSTITVKQNDGTFKTEQFCFNAITDKFALSPYFNAIVGGRGTGKSTILNFFGQHSSEENSSKEFWKKISPSFEPKDETIFSFDGVKQFEFIGQSEVESFAMNKQAFTDAIYNRADILSNSGLTNAEQKLTPLLDEITNYQNLIIEISELDDEIDEVDVEIDTLKKSIKITKSKQYSTIAESITNNSNDLQELASWRELIDEYREAIAAAQDLFESSKDEEADEDSQSTAIAKDYELAFEKAKVHLTAALKEIDEAKFTKLVKKEGALQKTIEENEEKLSQLLEEAGLSEENVLQVKSAPQKLVQLTEKRKKLVKRKDEKSDSLKNYASTLAEIGTAKSEFETKIGTSITPLNTTLRIQAEENQHKDIKDIELQYYFDELNAWHDIAEEFYETFEDAYSDGERSDYVKELITKNTTIFSGDYEQIKQFIQSKFKKSEDAGYLRFMTEVFEEEHNYKIFKAIRDRRLNDAVSYKRIQVLYGGRGIEFASFGQKCTAVVVILMLFGNYPLIIDEPEAHLDGSLIANYLVPLIKQKKMNRQIVFATHNANFVVNGDAEKIIILKNDGHPEFIETTIEDTSHREDLLKLEGGKDAFKKRSDKLHIL